MAYWQSIASVTKRVASATGQEITAEFILGLAQQDLIRVGACIPAWRSPGNGELRWYNEDGTPSPSVASDGIASWLTRFQLKTLEEHGRVTLAGTTRTIQMYGEAGQYVVRAWTDSHFITLEDIRIPEDQVPRIVAAIQGASLSPYPQGETTPGVTPPRCGGNEHTGAALIAQGQEILRKIVKLQDTEPSLHPTEREAARRLLKELSEEYAAIEANPRYRAAIEYRIQEMEGWKLDKRIDYDYGENRQALASIEAEIDIWRKTLKRLKGASEPATSANNVSGSTDAEPGAIPTPKVQPRNRAQTHLLKIIEALENYAEETRQEFDRHAMPGPLGDDWHQEGSFHWFCAKIYPAFKRKAATFKGHRAGICAIQKYAVATDFYRRALPNIEPMLAPHKTKK